MAVTPDAFSPRSTVSSQGSWSESSCAVVDHGEADRPGRGAALVRQPARSSTAAAAAASAGATVTRTGRCRSDRSRAATAARAGTAAADPGRDRGSRCAAAAGSPSVKARKFGSNEKTTDRPDPTRSSTTRRGAAELLGAPLEAGDSEVPLPAGG